MAPAVYYAAELANLRGRAEGHSEVAPTTT